MRKKAKAVEKTMAQALESTTLSSEPKNTSNTDKAECDCPDNSMKRIRSSSGWPCPECQPNSYAEELRKNEEKQKQEQLEKEKRIREEKVQLYLNHSHLPPRMRNQSFENYQIIHPGQQHILNRCRDYAEKFPEHQISGKMILLTGPCGTGKGHMSAAIAQHVIKTHVQSVLYYKLIDLVGEIKDSWCHKSRNYFDRQVTEETIIEDCRTTHLLIIDEIGMQFGSDTERLYLYRILDHRYEWNRPTIMTTNLTIAQLKPTVGTRVYDRLCEPPNEIILLNWPSYRQAAGKVSTKQNQDGG